jgi:hypothetical protein
MSYTINGSSLDDIIWQALSLDGHVAPMPPQWAREALAQGASAFAPTVALRERQLRLSLDIRPITLPERVAVMDTLARRLAGALEIGTDDVPMRVWDAMLAEVRVEMPAGPVANPMCLVDLAFTTADPRRRDRETSVRALSGTAVACPTGTAVAAPIVTLFGDATPVVDPSVVLRRADGQVAATLALTGSLGADTWLEIDAGTEWVWLSTAGVRTSALAWVTSGTFPLLSGEDAATADGPFPTLQLTAASGTPTGVVRWRRRWA